MLNATAGAAALCRWKLINTRNWSRDKYVNAQANVPNAYVIGRQANIPLAACGKTRCFGRSQSWGAAQINQSAFLTVVRSAKKPTPQIFSESLASIPYSGDELLVAQTEAITARSISSANRKVWWCHKWCRLRNWERQRQQTQPWWVVVHPAYFLASRQVVAGSPTGRKWYFVSGPRLRLVMAERVEDGKSHHPDIQLYGEADE